MNIKLKSAFFVVLFFSPTSLHSKQAVRIANRKDCVKFTERLIKELEQESAATRPDGKRTIFASDLSALLISLRNKKEREAFINKIFKSFSSACLTNVTLENDETLKDFLKGYVGGS